MPTILVADDNRANRDALASLLEAAGYSVLLASDGAEALEMARERRPDVVISDVLMPRMDGYELARRLRESQDLASGARLIAVTGYGQDADRERSRQAGFDSHLVKPVNLDVLSDAVVN